MRLDLERQLRIVAELRQRLDMATAMNKKVESEIADCEHIEKQVLENIRILRQERIVVSVQEFKSVLKDLNQVRHSMVRLRTYQLERAKEVENCSKALKQATEVCKQAEAQQQTALIHVDFRRKDGQG